MYTYTRQKTTKKKLSINNIATIFKYIYIGCIQFILGSNGRFSVSISSKFKQIKICSSLFQVDLNERKWANWTFVNKYTKYDVHTLLFIFSGHANI